MQEVGLATPAPNRQPIFASTPYVMGKPLSQLFCQVSAELTSTSNASSLTVAGDKDSLFECTSFSQLEETEEVEEEVNIHENEPSEKYAIVAMSKLKELMLLCQKCLNYINP